VKNAVSTSQKKCAIIGAECQIPDGYVLVLESDYNKLCAAVMTMYQSSARVLNLPPLLTRKQQKRMASDG
jgi:hypothetical protein